MASFLLTASELRARGGGKWGTYPPDVLPAWVADMDFRVAPAVDEAIRRFSDTQDYGYGLLTDLEPLYAAFSNWMERRHGWAPDPTLTHATIDVVQGIVATISAFTEAGEGVIAQTPVYPPFLTAIANTGRRLVENPLIKNETGFRIDVEGLAAAAPHARLLLLCNPHNPTGRVLTRDELVAIADIAHEHHLTIVADEIHADLVYPGHAGAPGARHIPMETLAPERTVTLTSATKGFNIPAVRTAIAHFGSPELRDRFDRAIPEHLLGWPSRFGVAGTIAAWREGEAWLEEVLRYLERNRQAVSQWAVDMSLGYHPPEATYLAWFDLQSRRLPNASSPHEHCLEHAKVALSDGAMFGEPGRGHVRLNFATSAEILDDILARLSAALD